MIGPYPQNGHERRARGVVRARNLRTISGRVGEQAAQEKSSRHGREESHKEVPESTSGAPRAIMGNFSNDPQARLTESLGKHYVGVRMQQAVPVLDSDWNLLEDLRKHELESFGTWFIGSGVPTGSDGFAIFSVVTANDFGIRHGTCLAGGRLTENSADVTYATQPNFGAPDVFPPSAALTTPAADKSFIAYLDVWEREVDSQKDPAWVDARIGVEPAGRRSSTWGSLMTRVP